MNWHYSKVAADGSHHLLEGAPLYSNRFDEVLKFHAPGLAAVRCGDEAWHIHPDGSRAYRQHFMRTFGFYQNLAAVEGCDGWHHIHPDGTNLTDKRYNWCGNFQGNLCTLRQSDGKYLHITTAGLPAYPERWQYAGDFRDGIGVVQAEDGLATHIDCHGCQIHGKWFQDADVFHKSFARARDNDGWMHVDAAGQPIYTRRFAAVEPFYNGQARIECLDGGVEIINESGRTLHSLRAPAKTAEQQLSELIVGFWKTQVVHVAAKLRVFDCLPASSKEAAEAIGLSADSTHRLLRGLWELNLVQPHNAGWTATETGALLHSKSPSAMADAASHWGTEHYTAWAELESALATGEPGFDKIYGQPFFAWLAEQPERLHRYHRAMQGYARHDYSCLINYLPLDGGEHIIDAGGGTGSLIASLLAQRPDLRGTLLDRPEVIALPALVAQADSHLQLVGADLFAPWPCQGDVIVLARVLHDWDDARARLILQHARQALNPNGRIALIEIALSDDTPEGSLLDLNMLVICGAQERTTSAWETLAKSAGLRLNDTQRLPTYGSLLLLSPIDTVNE